MPVLTTINQWKEFHHNGMDIENKQDSKIFGSDKLGSTYVNKRDLVTELFDKVVFLPFWHILLIYSLEILLLTIFILTITIYASAMTNRKSISMGISVGIIGGLYSIYKFFPKIPNPFLSLETRNIINGASNFTLLSLTLIQVTSIIIVFLVGNYLFNKKDISY